MKSRMTGPNWTLKCASIGRTPYWGVARQTLYPLGTSELAANKAAEPRNFKLQPTSAPADEIGCHSDLDKDILVSSCKFDISSQIEPPLPYVMLKIGLKAHSVEFLHSPEPGLPKHSQPSRVQSPASNWNLWLALIWKFEIQPEFFS